MRNREKTALARELRLQATILGGFVLIFWILEITDQFIFQNLGRGIGVSGLDLYGIVPRNFLGLRGILFAPFLHGDFPHLIANTLPFITLGWFVMLQETTDFIIVTLVTMAVGGLGTWLFGAPNSVHIGASSLIFGYLGFLLLRGYFERNFPSILLSIIVGILYGSLVWGVLPSQPGISWEGHLFGFLGGILAARMIAKVNRRLR